MTTTQSPEVPDCTHLALLTVPPQEMPLPDHDPAYDQPPRPSEQRQRAAGRGGDHLVGPVPCSARWRAAWNWPRPFPVPLVIAWFGRVHPGR
jgi:hypothetical protein